MSALNAQPDPGADERLQRAVLSDQVKEFIVEAILTGEYRPGDRVVESALARRLGVTVVVSGERELHDGRTKLNQSPPALDAYSEMARRYGVELAQPLRLVDGEEELARLTGDWKEGVRQRGCVLAGHHPEMGASAEGPAWPPALEAYLQEYLLPVTTRMLDACLKSGRADVAGIVEGVLAEMGEG